MIIFIINKSIYCLIDNLDRIVKYRFYIRFSSRKWVKKSKVMFQSKFIYSIKSEPP